MKEAVRTVLIAHPAPDLYGADLQMLQSVTGLVEAGWRVVVAVPRDGELVPRLLAAGAEVVFLDFPVLRKGNARPGALVRMLAAAGRAVPRSMGLIRRLQASVLLVNTVTLPWWVLAGRLSRTPVIVHLHEAETEGRRIVRSALIAPLRLADAVIVISTAALNSMIDVQPKLAARAHLIYNGVPQPPDPPVDPPGGRSTRLAVVGRLSPRKAPDVALEATAELRRAGYDVTLEVAGSTFEGYAWYEDRLRQRAGEPDLRGAVDFSGYCSPIWPVLERADIALAPSLREPFGNAVVEAQMSCRPVVAAASQGHLESVVDGETGLLVPAGDSSAMARAVKQLIDDRELAARIARAARAEAVRRFSVQRYRLEVAELTAATAARSAVGLDRTML